MIKRNKMIYLNNSTTPQSVLIPRNGCDLTGRMIFSLKSTMLEEGTPIESEVIDDGSSKYYFSFSALINGIAEGEYEFHLKQNGKVIAKGLAHIGESTSPSEYNKELSYEQYYAE